MIIRISQSAPTGSACCGVSGVKEHAAKRAIAGWSGSYHYVTPVASEVDRHFLCWSRRLPVYSKVSGLICAGSRSMSLYRFPLPRDQILLYDYQYDRINGLRKVWMILIVRAKDQKKHLD
jgi:hypothetical protein